MTSEKRLSLVIPIVSLTKTLQQYQSHFEAEGSIASVVCGAENPSSRYANIQTCSELLHIVERHLDKPNVEQLSMTDLIQLEKQLDAALLHTRSKKTQLVTESMNALHEKERMLREENKLLMKQIAELENNSNKMMVFHDIGNNYMTSHPELAMLRLL